MVDLEARRKTSKVAGPAIAALAVLLFCVGPAGADRPRAERRLRHPAVVHQLQPTPGIVVRNSIRAWGTERAIRVFRQAVETVRVRFAGTPDIPVGDLSWRGGGRMRPHVSHRDGRDMDVGYYFADGEPRERLSTATSETIDAARTWALLESMIETGDVEYLFVWYRLQKPLYEQALKSGRTPEELRDIFQWPRSPWNRVGIIRHLRGHDDHFHVRFRK